MSCSSLPIEEWFIFRQDAAEAYLVKILREIRWKASDDALTERLGLASMCQFVRSMEPGVEPCECGCHGYKPRCKVRVKARLPVRCGFRFEMDRGRPNLGHEYLVQVHGPSTILWRMDKWKERIELGELNEVTPKDLLQAIRECVVAEIMTE